MVLGSGVFRFTQRESPKAANPSHPCYHVAAQRKTRGKTMADMTQWMVSPGVGPVHL